MTTRKRRSRRERRRAAKKARRGQGRREKGREKTGDRCSGGTSGCVCERSIQRNASERERDERTGEDEKEDEEAGKGVKERERGGRTPARNSGHLTVSEAVSSKIDARRLSQQSRSIARQCARSRLLLVKSGALSRTQLEIHIAPGAKSWGEETRNFSRWAASDSADDRRKRYVKI